MGSFDQSEQIREGEMAGEAGSTCVDLVPVTPPLQARPKQPLTRPDAGFVTQLIAMQAQVPQTRNLRRGTPAEAQTAYATHPRERRGVARRTRQIV